MKKGQDAPTVEVKTTKGAPPLVAQPLPKGRLAILEPNAPHYERVPFPGITRPIKWMTGPEQVDLYANAGYWLKTLRLRGKKNQKQPVCRIVAEKAETGKKGK